MKQEDTLTQEIEKYDKLFGGTHYNSNPHHDRFKAAEEFALQLGGSTLLDVGVGRGHFMKRMIQHGFHVTGVEPSSAARDVSDNSLIDAYAHDMPLPDQSFDIVCCLDVLEHVPRAYIEPSLAEMARVTKGPAIISAADHSDIVDGVELHISSMPFDQWQRLIEAHFTVVDARVVCSKADASKISKVFLLRSK